MSRDPDGLDKEPISEADWRDKRAGLSAFQRDGCAGSLVLALLGCIALIALIWFVFGGMLSRALNR